MAQNKLVAQAQLYIIIYIYIINKKGKGFFGHPEVKNIGFLTLLYAGTTFIIGFKYSILIDTVKNLKLKSISAGNIPPFPKRFVSTSETLHNETVVK